MISEIQLPQKETMLGILCPHCQMRLVSVKKSKSTIRKEIVLKEATNSDYLLKCPRCKHQIGIAIQ